MKKLRTIFFILASTCFCIPLSAKEFNLEKYAKIYNVSEDDIKCIMGVYINLRGGRGIWTSTKYSWGMGLGGMFVGYEIEYSEEFSSLVFSPLTLYLQQYIILDIQKKANNEYLLGISRCLKYNRRRNDVDLFYCFFSCSTYNIINYSIFLFKI